MNLFEIIGTICCGLGIFLAITSEAGLPIKIDLGAVAIGVVGILLILFGRIIYRGGK